MKRFFLLDSYKASLQFERQQFENIQQPAEGIYLSPFLYKKIQGSEMNQIYDKKKNDVFALGMLLLELAIQTKLHQFYLPNGEVNPEFLNNCFIVLEKKLASSPALIADIKLMLELDDSKRSSVEDLLATKTVVASSAQKVAANKYIKLNKENQYQPHGAQIQQKNTGDYEVTFETDS